MKRLWVHSKLNVHKTSDLIFSCVRSKIAYYKDTHINRIYHNKNNILKFVPTINPNIKKDLTAKVNAITHPPIVYKQNEAQSYLIFDNNTIYVTFRGTLDIKDVLDNIDIRHHTIHKDIKVHKGFYEKFKSVEEDITKDIKHIAKHYNIKNLSFTGHSSGANCALICSPYYGELFKNQFKITTHTFGCAPCGNYNFVNWFISNIDENARIETEGDIVPYIPIHDHFYHVPNGIKLKKDYTYENQYQIDPYNYFKLLTMILNKESWDLINQDHSCENYIDKLFHLDDIVCF